MAEYTVTYEVHISTKVEAEMAVSPEVSDALRELAATIRDALVGAGLDPDQFSFEVANVSNVEEGEETDDG